MFAAIDIETTGLQRSCSMTELAVCTAHEEMLWRAPDLLSTNEEATTSCALDALLSRLRPLLHDHIVVGYNVFFDLRWLATLQGASALTLLVVDLLPIAQRLMRRQTPPRLGEACAHLGVSMEGPMHRALPDARRALALAQRLAVELPSPPLRVHLGRLA